MIFLDHNSTTPLRPEALEAMLPYLKEEYGNASSIHQAGQHARKAIEEARREIADFIGASDPNEIVFTSGGTEANNTALKGALETGRGKGRRLISSAIEHSAVRSVAKHLADIGKADHVVAPVDKGGIVIVEEVAAAATPDTVLVAVMAANNEIGTLQPTQAIAEICRKKNIPYLVDAVQWAGKIPIHVTEWGADYLSLSAHKFGGPKGVGCLYVKKGTRLEALVHGGRQESNRRAGTENVAGIIGMAAAARLAKKELGDTQRIAALRDLLEDLLMKGLKKVSINGNTTKRLCNTTNLCFDYTENTALLMALDLKGIATSSGSACAAGSPDPSHVLLAMGLPREKALASLRFSLSHTNTEEEIRSAAQTIIETVERVRSTHPLWNQAANG